MSNSTKLLSPGQVASWFSRMGELSTTLANSTAQTRLYDNPAYSETEIEIAKFLLEELPAVIKFMEDHKQQND